MTVSGNKCQAWTSQFPHEHETTPELLPNKGLGKHAYCRNPDGEDTIWCYTIDSDKRWESCEPLDDTSVEKEKIEKKKEVSENLTGKGEDYRGR